MANQRRTNKAGAAGDNNTHLIINLKYCRVVVGEFKQISALTLSALSYKALSL